MGRIIDISEALLELGLSGSVTEQERGIVQTAITRAEGAVKRHLKYDPVLTSRTEYYPMIDRLLSIRDAVWEVSSTDAYIRDRGEGANQLLQVRHIPIRSVPVIDLRVDYGARSGTVVGSFAAETQKIEGSDFWPNYDSVDSDGNKVCLDGLIRNQGSWPSEAGSIRIVYSAGYTPEELHGQDDVIDASPIMDAVLDETVRRTKKAFTLMKSSVGLGTGVLTAERMGDYSYSASTSSVDALFGGKSDLLAETMSKLEAYVNFGWALGG